MRPKIFKDRRDAGQELALKLRGFAKRTDTTVLALPRGGVPVAAEIARSLCLSLDVLVVRKLGAPDQPELAIGAIASGGAVVMNPEVRAYYAHQPTLVDAITTREQEELRRREQVYRTAQAPLMMENRTAIVVDDGAATGATMRAAVQALRVLGAKRIVIALPVCSLEAERMLAQEADEVVCLEVPPSFYAVGQWYRDFDQTTDDEVNRLLRDARESAKIR